MAVCLDVVCGGLKVVFTVCKEIRDYLVIMGENNYHCERILSAVANLETAAYELKKLEDDELSEHFKISLRKWRDSLDIAKETFKSLKRKSSLLNVRSTQKMLERLEFELKKACEDLQFALQIVCYAQQKELKETVQQESQVIRNMVMNRKRGIYLNPHGHSQVPDAVEKPSVSMDPLNHLLVVKWVDQKNDIKELDNYDILYDDENDAILSCKPEEAVLFSCATQFTMKLGEPKVSPGRMYNVRIRAVNGVGPGKWSEASLIRFKKGPPVKPQKPSLVVRSPTEVIVKVRELSKEEECGSPVTYCQVEFTEVGDDNDTGMRSETFSMKAPSEAVREREFVITKLKPNTQYCFRVIMANEIGNSPPSCFIKILTETLVPGPPHNVRISSKRKSSAIKVRWNKPIENPAGVEKYKVQFRKKSGTEWRTCATVGKNKHSQKVLQLNTDAVYYFRVQSLNKQDDGSHSERIEGKTRCGIFGRGVATVAAGVGGTVFGPVVGATSLGYLSATSAKKGPDSETAKTAAAIGAGIAGGIGGLFLGVIGAPIIGITTAMMANSELEGKMDAISPQSSDDDEDTETSIVDMLFKNSKATAEAFVEKNEPKKPK